MRSELSGAGLDAKTKRSVGTQRKKGGEGLNAIAEWRSTKQKFFPIHLHILLHESQNLEERTSRSVPRGEDGTRNISIPPGRDIVILSLNFYVVIIIPFIVVVTGGA